MTVGWKPPDEPRLRSGTRLVLRQPHDLQRPGSVRQAADEAALLKSRDEAVDARFGPQAERLLHLVEGRRYAVLAKVAVMNSSSSYCLRVSIGVPGAISVRVSTQISEQTRNNTLVLV